MTPSHDGHGVGTDNGPAPILVSAAPAGPPPATHPATGARRFRLRFLLAPVRFAIRRPRRALLIVLASAAVLAAAGAVGTQLWFEHHLRLARAAVDHWHNAAAFTHLSACRSLRPAHGETLLLSARLARRVAAWSEAESLLEQYAAAHGEDDGWAFETLLHRAARGETDAIASGIRTRIGAGGPQARAAREALVLGLTDLFRLSEAIAVLEEWQQASPDDPIALLLLGKVTELLNGQEQAMQLYQRVLEQDPDVLDARLRLAAILVDRRRGEQAAEHLAVLLERLPHNLQVQLLWAQTLRLLGRTPEARRLLDGLLAAHPDDPRVLAESGGLALHDPDRGAVAEALLGRAVRLDPADVATRNQYALALTQNGKAAEAAEQYKQVSQFQADSERFRALMNGPLQAHSDDPALYHEIGIIALRAGHTRDALRWFERGLAADPEHLPTHSTLAFVYQQLDNPGMAARHRAMAQKVSAERRKK